MIMLCLATKSIGIGRAMTGATLKRYIATIVCNPGTGQETTRDTAEILAADDDAAVRQANDWLRRSGIAEAGDFLVSPKTDAA